MKKLITLFAILTVSAFAYPWHHPGWGWGHHHYYGYGCWDNYYRGWYAAATVANIARAVSAYSYPRTVYVPQQTVYYRPVAAPATTTTTTVITTPVVTQVVTPAPAVVTNPYVNGVQYNYYNPAVYQPIIYYQNSVPVVNTVTPVVCRPAVYYQY